MANFDINKLVMESVESTLGEAYGGTAWTAKREAERRAPDVDAQNERGGRPKDPEGKSMNPRSSSEGDARGFGSAPQTNVSSSVSPDRHGDAAPKGKIASALARVREKAGEAKEKIADAASKAKDKFDELPTAAKVAGGGALAIGAGLAAGKGALALRNRLRKAKK